MELNWVITFIVIIGIIAIAGFLLKSFAKVILILGVIYVLFHLGFIWGVDDLNDKLHLNKFLKPEVNEQVQETYSKFAEKRDKTGVIDKDLVKKTIDDSLQIALTKASNEIKNIDKEALIQDLSEKLRNFDTETVAKVLNDLKAELAKYNVTPEEVQQATTK